MKERGVGKPWTQQEDSLLTQAVAVYGENDNWKNVASYVPGRTNKACRKRWLHSLSPSVKKTAWTAEEDQLLLSLYAKHGTKWSVIARQIPGRTDDACSKRYREALDPSLKRDEWTPEEDILLLEAYSKLGVKWGQVGQRLNRSGLACRNRWRMLERRKAHAAPSSEHNSSPPVNRQSPELDNSAVAMPQSWELPIPYIDSSEFWPSDPQYTSPTTILPEDSTDIPLHPAYLSPHYSGDLEPGEIIEAFPTSAPPPFQFTSSSLSSALSLSAISPSSTYVSSPHANRVPEVFVNAYNNNTQCSNTQSQVSSSAAFEGDIEQANTIPAYPPSPRYSPDLSALGSQDISVPVPFDDTRRECNSTYDTAISQSHQLPRIEVPVYPTPEASPHLDESLATLASPTHSQGSDRGLSRHYRTPAQKKKASEIKTTSGVKKSSQKTGLPRLSASLPASSDRTVLAYVCGHDACWAPGHVVSSCRYTTSQELYDHWKLQHIDDPSCERPYRCGVEGCGKGWKSINGLQYHLQLSKAHFQQAISATLTRQGESAASEGIDAPTGCSKKKLFSCTFPNCPNQYKQMSGLRYHLAHGHSQQLPTQLDYVPPALARKVADKLQGRVSQASTPPLSTTRPGP